MAVANKNTEPLRSRHRHVHALLIRQETDVAVRIAPYHRDDDDFFLAALEPIHCRHLNLSSELKLRRLFLQLFSKLAYLGTVRRDDSDVVFLGARFEEFLDNLDDQVHFTDVELGLRHHLVFLDRLIHKRAGCVDKQQGVTRIKLGRVPVLQQVG